MRRFITSAFALAVCGLCWASQASAQDKAPAKTETCAASCLHKVCVSVPDKKKISKVEYSCTQKDICLPRCPKLFGGCCDEGCADCGRPRTVNVLMKRTVTTECPSTKCVVSHQEAAPRCAQACRVGHGACCVETLPAATTMPMAPATVAQPLPTGSQSLIIETGR
jgi:hypothetical protein